MKNNKVKAILDTDLEEMLKRTNQYEKIINHKIFCKSCGTVITIENIGIIIPVHKDDKSYFEFYCERIDCLEHYKRLNNEY